MKFEKILTKNDIGLTGSHQAGFHIPKSNKDLIDFLPNLDHTILNPSIFIDFYDNTGYKWKFRYIYYNSKLHSQNGTRNEFRITHTTIFMKHQHANEGDTVVIEKKTGSDDYIIYIKRHDPTEPTNKNRIKLKGWQTVY